MFVTTMFIANAIPGLIQARPDMYDSLVRRVRLVVLDFPGTLEQQRSSIGTPGEVVYGLRKEAYLVSFSAVEWQQIDLRRAGAIAQESQPAPIGRPARGS
jgi:hypothetical protein